MYQLCCKRFGKFHCCQLWMRRHFRMILRSNKFGMVKKTCSQKQNNPINHLISVLKEFQMQLQWEHLLKIVKLDPKYKLYNHLLQQNGIPLDFPRRHTQPLVQIATHLVYSMVMKYHHYSLLIYLLMRLYRCMLQCRHLNKYSSHYIHQPQLWSTIQNHHLRNLWTNRKLQLQSWS